MKKDARAIWDAIKMAHSYDKNILPARAVQALLDVMESGLKTGDIEVHPIGRY